MFNTKYPRWIVLQLLEDCNLRCKMCYEWGKEASYNKKAIKAELDPIAIKKLVQDCSPIKPYYDLFGGEPLLYKSLDDILEVIRYYGSKVDIPTNGTLLESKSDMLVENEPNRIWVSLDGPEEINDAQRGKGVYRKAINGIQALYECREKRGKSFPRIGVAFIITPLNYQYIEDFVINHLDIHMLDHISVEVQLYSTPEQCQEYTNVLKSEFSIEHTTYAQGMIWDPKEFQVIDTEELARQISVVQKYCEKNNVFFITYPQHFDAGNLNKYFTNNKINMSDRKTRCGMPWIYAEITANGDASPCHSYYDLTFGNINNESFLNIWNNTKYKKFRDYMKGNLLPICNACVRYYTYNSKTDILG